jgi:hypothetical protein
MIYRYKYVFALGSVTSPNLQLHQVTSKKI